MLKSLAYRFQIAAAIAIPVALAFIVIEPQEPLVALAAGLLSLSHRGMPFARARGP